MIGWVRSRAGAAFVVVLAVSGCSQASGGSRIDPEARGFL